MVIVSTSKFLFLTYKQTPGLRLPDSIEDSYSLNVFKKQHMENEEESNCVIDGAISRFWLCLNWLFTNQGPVVRKPIKLIQD